MAWEPSRRGAWNQWHWLKASQSKHSDNTFKRHWHGAHQDVKHGISDIDSKHLGRKTVVTRSIDTGMGRI